MKPCPAHRRSGGGLRCSPTIIAYESGVRRTVDPLWGGKKSYFLETLTLAFKKGGVFDYFASWTHGLHGSIHRSRISPERVAEPLQIPIPARAAEAKENIIVGAIQFLIEEGPAPHSLHRRKRGAAAISKFESSEVLRSNEGVLRGLDTLVKLRPRAAIRPRTEHLIGQHHAITIVYAFFRALCHGR